MNHEMSSKDDIFAWAAQFTAECSHEERKDVNRGPCRDYQQVIEVCTVCGDERATARVMVWR